jgi:multidrug efflux pump subunit AcrA (membrane-fusion protein)
VPVLAPFEGQIAEVFVIPGQAVSAGDPLARLVRVEPLWVEVALPAESSVLSGPLGGLHLLPVGATEAISIPAERVRLVSRAPSVDAETGTVTVVLEIGGGSEIPPIGSAVQAEIVHGGEREGLVIPASALVDDAGVPVAYVQIEGESFERREIKIVMRQGNSLLVEGLEPGERLVTRGGAAIRRASLISSGVGEGHVH